MTTNQENGINTLKLHVTNFPSPGLVFLTMIVLVVNKMQLSKKQDIQQIITDGFCNGKTTTDTQLEL